MHAYMHTFKSFLINYQKLTLKFKIVNFQAGLYLDFIVVIIIVPFITHKRRFPAWKLNNNNNKIIIKKIETLGICMHNRKFFVAQSHFDGNIFTIAKPLLPLHFIIEYFFYPMLSFVNSQRQELCFKLIITFYYQYYYQFQ